MQKYYDMLINKYLLISGATFVLGIVFGFLINYFTQEEMLQGNMVGSIIESLNVSVKIRHGYEKQLLIDLDSQIDQKIEFSDQILTSNYRLVALWKIKDYVINNKIKISENSKSVLNSLPIADISTCEKLGKSKVRPSALGVKIE